MVKVCFNVGNPNENRLDPKIIVSIENKDIDETNRSIKLPNKIISFSIQMMMIFGIQLERKSDSKYLFYRSRIQFYSRQILLEVDQDFDLPTSPEFFKRRF